MVHFLLFYLKAAYRWSYDSEALERGRIVKSKMEEPWTPNLDVRYTFKPTFRHIFVNGLNDIIEHSYIMK